MKHRVEKLEKAHGKRGSRHCMACGYNENDEILYQVLPGTPDKNVYTEKEIREMYPEDEYILTFKVIGVKDNNGEAKRDEKGRPEIAEFTGI